MYSILESVRRAILCCLLARAAGHKSNSWYFWKILPEQNKDAALLSSPKTGLMQDLTCVR